MKMKRLFALLLALLCAAAITGCGDNLDALDASFDEDAVIQTAKKITEYIIAKDFDSATAMVREDLQAALSPDTISDAYDQILDGIGDFVEYTETLTAGTTDKETGEKFAAVRLKAKFDTKHIYFTVYMDSDLHVTALYMK